MHPLKLVQIEETELLVPEIVEKEGEEPWHVPVPQKTNGNGNGHDGEEGTVAARNYVAKMLPKVARKMVEIALTSPNHNASRAAGRDLMQIGGLLIEGHKVDVVVSFRAIFAQMTGDELQAFLGQKVFPERLREEALKLLEHHK